MRSIYWMGILAIASTLYVLAAPSKAFEREAEPSKTAFANFKEAKHNAEKKIKNDQKEKWNEFRKKYQEKSISLKAEKEAEALVLKEANKKEWKEWKERYKNAKTYAEKMKKEPANALVTQAIAPVASDSVAHVDAASSVSSAGSVVALTPQVEVASDKVAVPTAPAAVLSTVPSTSSIQAEHKPDSIVVPTAPSVPSADAKVVQAAGFIDRLKSGVCAIPETFMSIA